MHNCSDKGDYGDNA